ncbi:MAG: GNAT family N-acetyltransferase, partial [Mycobacteriales bacterium]
RSTISACVAPRRRGWSASARHHRWCAEEATPMPWLVAPVVNPGRLAGMAQPSIRSQTAGLILRPWRAEDAPQLVEAFADEEIQRWLLRSLDSEQEAVAWVADWHDRWTRSAGASWAVTPGEDQDKVLGQVAFRSLHLNDGLAELSFWVIPEHRKHGIASSAATALVSWSVQDLGLQRLEIVHSVQNEAACGAATLAGFRIEGVRRSLQLHTDGFHDMHLHARLRTDDGLPVRHQPGPDRRHRPRRG